MKTYTNSKYHSTANPSLYPTFKEWKHAYYQLARKTTAFVYILPLRNENMSPETRSPWTLNGLYPTFKEWKLTYLDLGIADGNYVYILPLRNENLALAGALWLALAVYILPLRNENLYPLGWQVCLRGGLYPTFKEWKPE